MDHAVLYLVLTGVFGLFMAWAIGANDVANAMATSIGSKAVTIRQALFIAAIFEFGGAVLAGGAVTSTIRKGIVEMSAVAGHPTLLIYGMLAALLASGIWLTIATRFGWPVSTTHSIVGAIVGFASVGLGVDSVQWGPVAVIVLGWVLSPVVGGIVAYLIFSSVQRFILERQDPLAAAQRFVPFYMFLAAFTISAVTLIEGLSHIGLTLTLMESYTLAVGIGIVIALIGAFAVNRIIRNRGGNGGREAQFATIERIFGVLQIVTACSMAFAHGSNDVANAIGPVAAVVSVVRSGVVGQTSSLSLWILILGGGGIVLGLATFGRKVISTVGEGITALTPSRGFSAEFAAATTIVIGSGIGMPVSTTQTLVGAVLGVGMARGIAAIDLRVVRGILLSWFVTVPAGALLSMLIFYLIKLILG
ncbi:MAG TPA: anion permease [Gammaproteobacteria bacterium]|nr:anion permease [Gammaproteobacteria bacterium]